MELSLRQQLEIAKCLLALVLFMVVDGHANVSQQVHVVLKANTLLDEYLKLVGLFAAAGRLLALLA